MGQISCKCRRLGLILALLLTLSAVPTPTYGSKAPVGSRITHSCIHDTLVSQDVAAGVHRHLLEQGQRSEEEKQDSRQRALVGTGSAPIRITPVYAAGAGAMATHVNVVKTQIIPNATRFFQRALHVRAPLQSPLKLRLPDATCLDVPVDSKYLAERKLCDQMQQNCQTLSGGAGAADTDFLLFVSIESAAKCTGDTAAFAGACAFDLATGRPVAALANLCPNFFNNYKDGDQEALRNMLNIAIHELTHALVFSPALFVLFTDAQGNKVNAKNALAVSSPEVVARGRAHFGCPSLDGVRLEDEGGEGTKGSHWESSILANELMVGVLREGSAQVFSPLTLAAFADSGWYDVVWSTASAIRYGMGAGCDFVNLACSAGGAAFKNYNCDASTDNLYFCTADGEGQGPCETCGAGQTCLFDNCPRVMSPFSCRNPDVPAGGAPGLGSRCVGTTTAPWRSNSGSVTFPRGAACLPMTCSGPPNNPQLSVMVGSTQVTCVDGQMVDLPKSAYSSGSIGPCPVAATFCQFMGCPNDCSNQGTCVNGTCSCYQGYAGTTCAEFQCFPGQCAAGLECDNDLGICKAPGPPSPPPPPAPPRPPPQRSKGPATAILLITVKFDGLSLASQRADDVQQRFIQAMSDAASTASKSAGFDGTYTVSVTNMRQGSIIVDGYIVFAPTSDSSVAMKAANKLQSRLQSSPASIFASDPVLSSASSISTTYSSVQEGAPAPSGAGAPSTAETQIKKIIQNKWVRLAFFALLVLSIVFCLLSCIRRFCCANGGVFKRRPPPAPGPVYPYPPGSTAYVPPPLHPSAPHYPSHAAQANGWR